MLAGRTPSPEALCGEIIEDDNPAIVYCNMPVQGGTGTTAPAEVAHKFTCGLAKPERRDDHIGMWEDLSDTTRFLHNRLGDHLRRSSGRE